jgi:hypothetical protein
MILNEILLYVVQMIDNDDVDEDICKKIDFCCNIGFEDVIENVTVC